jgi:hypothetical protein
VIAVRTTAEMLLEVRDTEELDRRTEVRLGRSLLDNQARLSRDLASARERIDRLERFVELVLTRVDGDVDCPAPIRSAAGAGR